jgi:tRNA A-37 threonylcarbamoyl transferase component Bud32
VIWNSASKPKIPTPPGYQYLREGKRELLIRKGFEDRLRRQGLLNPAGLWNKIAQPDRLMGRGKVLLIKEKGGEVAVRKYRHGGLLRGLTGDCFFFGARPFQELAVTEEVKSAGVPTLQIQTAIMERGWGGWYRGHLITKYQPSATDLISYLDKERESKKRRAVITKAAQAVQKMHARGIYHADLHLKNFLVDEKKGRVLLIDFDKSKVFPHLDPSRRMKNLKRLDRSAEKLARLGLSLTKRDKEVFCRAYAAGDTEIRPYLDTYLKRYRWYQRMYRWGWWIARILYPRYKPWRKSSAQSATRPSIPPQK